MAFRRFNNSGRGSSRFRSRRRFTPTGNNRRTVPTRRYEWGEFFTENEDILPDIGGGPGDTTLVYTRLAQTRTIGDASTGQGVALISAARHIDVGGVVLDYAISPASGPSGLDDQTLLEGKMYCMVALVVDRVDGAGLPTSLTSWDPFVTSTPVASVSNSLSTPQGDTLDIDRPVRMLWQRTWAFDFLSRFVVGDEEGVLYVPNDQRVEIRPQTLNKRLKLRLQDELGLYFVRAYRPSANFTLPFVPLADFFFRGSIYYRFGF